MKILQCTVMIVAILFCTAVVAAEKPFVACSLMDEKEAAALVGGPLGEVFKNEQMPTVENGRDHNSVCGFFPKGYKIQTADRSPEQGVQLQLHVMQTDAAAKAFYENALASDQEMARIPGSPLAGDKISTLKGIGKAAFLTESKVVPGSSAVATISFLKGNVMGQVQVWKMGGPAGEIAKSAVRKVVTKLP